jgi:hypothetical protein
MSPLSLGLHRRMLKVIKCSLQKKARWGQRAWWGIFVSANGSLGPHSCVGLINDHMA